MSAFICLNGFFAPAANVSFPPLLFFAANAAWEELPFIERSASSEFREFMQSVAIGHHQSEQKFTAAIQY
ncbi:MAG: hypothetical protein ACPG6L_03325 [Nereida ignava]